MVGRDGCCCAFGGGVFLFDQVLQLQGLDVQHLPEFVLLLLDLFALLVNYFALVDDYLLQIRGNFLGDCCAASNQLLFCLLQLLAVLAQLEFVLVVLSL